MLLSMRLQLDKFAFWAGKYDHKEDAKVLQIGKDVKRQGFFTRDELISVCLWKSPRSISYCRKNTEEEVKEITRIAMDTKCERLRIEVLRLLHGVDWPTASVLLHIAHTEKYPLIDWRALWSLGWEHETSYNYQFWMRYTEKCRRLSDQTDLCMRKVDRALWKYSKENQK